MEAFFASGRAADLVLAVLAAEAVFLFLVRRRPLISALAIVLPGVCFALALRFALTGAPWQFVALCLTAAFPAHVIDLWRRPPR